MRALSELVPEVRVPDGPRRISRLAEAIGRAAADGDPRAADAVTRVQDSLARAVAVLAEVLAPDAVTLGGYPLHMGPGFFAGLDELIEKLLGRDSPLLPSLPGDEAPTLGAALMGREVGTADPAALRQA